VLHQPKDLQARLNCLTTIYSSWKAESGPSHSPSPIANIYLPVPVPIPLNAPLKHPRMEFFGWEYYLSRERRYLGEWFDRRLFLGIGRVLYAYLFQRKKEEEFQTGEPWRYFQEYWGWLCISHHLYKIFSRILRMTCVSLIIYIKHFLN